MNLSLRNQWRSQLHGHHLLAKVLLVAAACNMFHSHVELATASKTRQIVSTMQAKQGKLSAQQPM